MSYARKTPCTLCPFRRDVPGYLRRARAEQIAGALRDHGIGGGTTFPCHETAPRTDSPRPRWRACAGSILVTASDQGPNQAMRIAERLGLLNLERVQYASRHVAVFKTFAAFVRHHSRSWLAKRRPKRASS